MSKDIVVPGAARTPLPDKFKEVIDARIKIRKGVGELSSNGTIINNELCIMQATSYVLGYSPNSDNPPCTSATITGFMIELNDTDGLTSYERAQLKEVIADIINTAPTKVVVGYSPYKDMVGLDIVKDGNNEDYRAAESKRNLMLINFRLNYIIRPLTPIYNIPIQDILNFIRKLAAVAKFDEGKLITE